MIIPMINSHSGNIFSGEAVRGVRDQHAGLPHCAVPHHDAPVQNSIQKLQERKNDKKVPQHNTPVQKWHKKKFPTKANGIKGIMFYA